MQSHVNHVWSVHASCGSLVIRNSVACVGCALCLATKSSFMYNMDLELEIARISKCLHDLTLRIRHISFLKVVFLPRYRARSGARLLRHLSVLKKKHTWQLAIHECLSLCRMPKWMQLPRLVACNSLGRILDSILLVTCLVSC